MKKIKYSVIILLSIILQINISNAQKVGLVLSGGGAKGLAHIGVIRALEQNNIPIDYITGTSIGAIVGGLYSVGYSPDEMERLVASTEFENWVKGLDEDKYMYFFKRPDIDAAWVSLKFSGDSASNSLLPTNYISNHQMDFAFMQLWAQGGAAANYNFDSLMVPFRCVAADVHNKSQVVFSKGDLPLALRTSMSLPFVYKPIEVEGRLLWDGGIYNNFPADIMEKDFNPDVIIGCKVTSNSSRPNQDDLISQVLNLIVDKTNFSIPRQKGVMIEPDVANNGLLDFGNLNILATKGYNSTMEKMDTIKQLIKRRVYYVELDKKRKAFKAKLPVLLFDSITIGGLKTYQASYALHQIKKKQRIVTIEQLKAEYFKLLVDGNIEYLYPTAKLNKKTGYFDISFKAKKAKSFTAKVGGNISSTSINQGFAEIEYRYMRERAYKFNANIYFGRFYNSIFGKARVDFAGNIPNYIDATITYNRWDYIRSNPNIFFDDSRPTYLICNETHFKVNSGLPIGRGGMIYYGAAISNLDNKYYQTQYFKSTDTTDATSFNHVTAHLTYHESTINQKQYADRGTEFFIQMRYVVGVEKHSPGSTSITRRESNYNHGYYQFKSYYDNYTRLWGKFRIGFYLEAFHSHQGYFNNYTATILSATAFEPIPYSKTLFIDNFRAFTYLGGGIKTIYKFNEDLQLRLEGYLFQPYKTIMKETSQNGEFYASYGKALANRYVMATSALVYHTPVGPASLSINYFQTEGTRWYFQFNFGYILFNKKATD